MIAVIQGPDSWGGFFSGPLLFIGFLAVVFLVACGLCIWAFCRPSKPKPLNPRDYEEK